LIRTPSAWRAGGVNGECGNGSCQAFSDVGLYNYGAQDAQLASIAAKYSSSAGGADAGEPNALRVPSQRL